MSHCRALWRSWVAQPPLPALAGLTVALHGIVYSSQRLLYDPAARRPALLAWWMATAGLFGAWASIVALARVVRLSRTLVGGVVVVPVAYQLAWTFTAPVLSIDLYSYLTYAYSAHVGLNPYLHAPREWGGTPIGAELARYGWRATHGVAPYGPLWMLFMVLLGQFWPGVRAGLIAVKLLLLGCNIVSAAVVYKIANHLTGDGGLGALAAFWWNPLLLETAAEGHNDAAMTTAVLLGLWLTIRARHASAIAAFTSGVLLKYVPAVFFAPVLVYWRCGPGDRKLPLARSVLPSVLLVIAAFLPFWTGWSTFAGVLDGLHPKLTAGSAGALYALMLYVTVPAIAGVLTIALVTVLFVAALAAASARITDDRSIVHGCATIALAYVFVASPRFWPWYVLLPVALLCARGTMASMTLAGVVSFAARLVAPLSVVNVVNAMSWPQFMWTTTVVAVWLPLTCSVIWEMRSRRLESPAGQGSQVDGDAVPPQDA